MVTPPSAARPTKAPKSKPKPTANSPLAITLAITPSACASTMNCRKARYQSYVMVGCPLCPAPSAFVQNLSSPRPEPSIHAGSMSLCQPEFNHWLAIQSLTPNPTTAATEVRDHNCAAIEFRLLDIGLSLQRSGGRFLCCARCTSQDAVDESI